MGINVLVVVAHPDDEVLGCGGTILKHTRNGDNVTVAILGQGKSSRQNPENIDLNRSEILALRREAEIANDILGVGQVVFHDFPDNAMDSIPLLNVIQFVESLKSKYKPNIVYTHHHSDINIDHQIIFKSVITAFRPIRGDQVPCIYSCEVPSATEWQAPHAGFAFQPNVFVDIEDTLEAKKQALAAYQSELRMYPHPRSVQAIDIIAKRWGIMVGYMAAEPFVLVRSLVKRFDPEPRFIIRKADEQDESDILRWRNDETARIMSERKNIICEAEHSRWYRAKLATSTCCIYIAVGDMGAKLGMVRFDKVEDSVSRVSINVAPDLRVRGLGKKLLRVALDTYWKMNPEIILIEAVIKNDNSISDDVFAKVGFAGHAEADVSDFFKVTLKRAQSSHGYINKAE